ncbi:arginase family enzyme [Thermolongibacillus altinsuensis]|uniref:Arginase family enzyme n=1 Tax=Thermolongibacillus altinsuensis TaxID=575256 RepID=A0A4R1QLB4_9BACL|nr:arginase family protein [Thermolongibacillus altinsuensis]TCL46813.1 arginase family enzyme [Thermolongibacillus altinsuensis]
MSLRHSGVTFLNFDGTYLSQKQLLRFPHEWIDVNDLNGTNLYCDNRSLCEIEKRLSKRKTKGITFLGSGNYHYASYLLLKEIREPFTLVLFDHHTDTSEESLFPFISCGSWVVYVLKHVPLLKHVVIIGSSPSLSPSPNVTIFPKNNIDYSPKMIISNISTDCVYISIDKDVLRQEDAITNWDQGSMKLSVLLDYLQEILHRKDVIGVDICGEDRFASAKNEEANRKILEVCLHHASKLSPTTHSAS